MMSVTETLNLLFNKEGVMTGNFWKDKRVIVTGGAGFLGSFLIEKLIRGGADDILIPRIEHYELTDRD